MLLELGSNQAEGLTPSWLSSGSRHLQQRCGVARPSMRHYSLLPRIAAGIECLPVVDHSSISTRKDTKSPICRSFDMAAHPLPRSQHPPTFARVNSREDIPK